MAIHNPPGIATFLLPYAYDLSVSSEQSLPEGGASKRGSE